MHTEQVVLWAQSLVVAVPVWWLAARESKVLRVQRWVCWPSEHFATRFGRESQVRRCCQGQKVIVRLVYLIVVHSALLCFDVGSVAPGSDSQAGAEMVCLRRLPVSIVDQVACAYCCCHEAPWQMKRARKRRAGDES